MIHPVPWFTNTHLGVITVQQYIDPIGIGTLASNNPGFRHGFIAQRIALNTARGSIGVGLAPTKHTLVIVVY